jgi:hypothetical protein
MGRKSTGTALSAAERQRRHRAKQAADNLAQTGPLPAGIDPMRLLRDLHAAGWAVRELRAIGMLVTAGIAALERDNPGRTAASIVDPDGAGTELAGESVQPEAVSTTVRAPLNLGSPPPRTAASEP